MKRTSAALLLLIAFLLGFANIPWGKAAPAPVPAQSGVTAYDLINAMNALRVGYGLPALIVDPIVMAVSQNTAEIMAASKLSWHIGNVRGRIQAAGYGGGATVWATENFAAGKTIGLDEIMYYWSDYDHMLPAIIPAYCHVGAGIATASDGTIYYVLQAAYTDVNSCGEYKNVANPPAEPGGSSAPSAPAGTPAPLPVSQVIVPVKTATPDADGNTYHIVQPGQSFWSIAIAYRTTIKDLEYWNNLSREQGLAVGQKLLIPGENTAGYATPTPVGMVVPSTPAADGRIIHVVEPYHNLTTISEAYKVPLQTILALNGIQSDSVLRIGQELLIYPGDITPSATPRPLTPVERLTPAADGRYYHTVGTGETLTWIAGYYGIPLADLLRWNGLTMSSIIRPDQTLLLEVTPPVPTPTATSTLVPVTPTSTPSRTPTFTATPLEQQSQTPLSAVVTGQAVVEPSTEVSPASGLLPLGIGLFILGAALFFFLFYTSKAAPKESL